MLFLNNTVPFTDMADAEAFEGFDISDKEDDATLEADEEDEEDPTQYFDLGRQMVPTCPPGMPMDSSGYQYYPLPPGHVNGHFPMYPVSSPAGYFPPPGLAGMQAMPGFNVPVADDPKDDKDDSKTDPKKPEPEIDSALDDLINLDKELTAPALEEDVAVTLNKLFKHGRSRAVTKDLIGKFPRPANLNLKPLALNEEVKSNIPKFAKFRDLKAQGVQTALCLAANPLAQMISGAKAGQLDKTKTTQLALASMSMLAIANNNLNQIRRDTIKPNLNKKYQGICSPPKDESDLLFGDKLADRMKSSETTSNLGARLNRTTGGHQRGGRGRFQRFQPYPTFGLYGANGNYGWPSRGGRRGGNGESSNKDINKLNKSKLATVGSHPSRQTDLTRVSLSNDSFLSSAERKGSVQEQEHQGQEVTQVQAPETKVSSYDPIKLDFWGDRFEAGRLAKCVDQWAEITSDPKILSQIRGFKLDFAEDLPEQKFPMPEINFSEEERQFIRAELARLQDKKVIVKASHVKGEYISNIFLVEKSTPGEWRLILNLKRLNKFLEKSHFKMETLLTALALVTPGCTFMSFDFENAYYSISVFEPHRKYLRFTFEGVLWEFTCVANGVSSAPFWFTKIMKVALTHLRMNYDITVSGFLDDNLFVNYESWQQGLEKGRIAAAVLQKLGFTINIPKSVADPGITKIDHLGFVIDSTVMQVSLTEKKTNKILDAISKCLDQKQISIRLLASVKGKLEATGSANKHAKLWVKRLEIAKIKALEANKFDYEAYITLPQDCRDDLIFARNHLPGISAPVRVSDPDWKVFNDASNSGWGCLDPQTKQEGGGRWTEDEAKMHINALELTAALLSVKSLCSHKQGIHLRIATDNSTTLYAINKQGSTKPYLNEIAREIWLFAIERDIWLSAVHCPGKLMPADEASRVFDDNIEWTLSDSLFDMICARFGQPSIDLFASRLNNKLDRYAAWHVDPGAVWIDSFAENWSNEFFYAFPPFCVIARAVQKCIQDEAEGILVVPDWPSQPWYTLLSRYIVQEPFYFMVTDSELFLPFHSRTSRHPLCPLKMKAVHLCCRPICNV